VTAAAIVDGGAGYSTAPSLLIVSVPATITTSEAADAFTNATLTCSLGSAASVDANGNATGGVVTSVSVGTAGAGFDSRTDVRVRPWVSTPDEAFAKLPSTMFRVPDFRGSLPRGTGAASRVPGMSFGFASNYGDGYDGLSDSTIGRHGGEEKHTLTVDELAAHQHRQASGSASSGSFVQQSDNTGQFAYSDTAGGNIPHNTLPPYVIVSFIIKAK
jgi:hypothetical protein